MQNKHTKLSGNYGLDTDQDPRHIPYHKARNSMLRAQRDLSRRFKDLDKWFVRTLATLEDAHQGCVGCSENSGK